MEVYLALVLLLTIVAHEFAPGAVRNTTQLVDQVPVLLNGLSTGDIATSIIGKFGWSEEQESRLRYFLANTKMMSRIWLEM